jgi:hypothetical protein
MIIKGSTLVDFRSRLSDWRWERHTWFAWLPTAINNGRTGVDHPDYVWFEFYDRELKTCGRYGDRYYGTWRKK